MVSEMLKGRKFIMSLSLQLGLIYLVSEVLLTITRRSRSAPATKQDRSLGRMNGEKSDSGCGWRDARFGCGMRVAGCGRSEDGESRTADSEGDCGSAFGDYSESVRERAGVTSLRARLLRRRSRAGGLASRGDKTGRGWRMDLRCGMRGARWAGARARGKKRRARSKAQEIGRPCRQVCRALDFRHEHAWRN
jgi:hypothetical protein